MRAFELTADEIVAELLPKRWFLVATRGLDDGPPLEVGLHGVLVRSWVGCADAVAKAREVLDVSLPGRKLFRLWSGLELAGDVGGTHELVDLAGYEPGWQAETLMIHRWLWDQGAPFTGITITRDEATPKKDSEARPTIAHALDWVPLGDELMEVWRKAMAMEELP